MPKNRDLKTTQGIPLENMVIAEIPVKKAVSIGHLEVPNASERDNENKSEKL